MTKSDTFNFSRFCEYFKLDLKTCIGRVGLATLLCGLIPIAVIVMVSVFNIQSGEREVWVIGDEAKELLTSVTSVLYFLIVPIICYGKLTDKQLGTANIMIPASHAEKYTSMLINAMVILPAAFCAIYLATDAALLAMFPHRYENTMATVIARSLCSSPIVHFEDTYVYTPSIVTFFVPWMVSAAGLAGAVLFKKGKGAKTFITCTLSFFALVAIVGSINIPEIIRTIAGSWVIFQTFCAACCLTYVYYRTKKIEQ